MQVSCQVAVIETGTIFVLAISMPTILEYLFYK